MEALNKALFSLLRNEIDNTPLPDGLDFNIEELFSLAKKQDLSHLIIDAAIKNGLVKKDSKYEEQIILAVFRYKQQHHEYQRICECFQKNSITFVPLKGILIRDYYSEPWMRTSCDLDILIHEEDLEAAKKALLELGFVTDEVRNYHDFSFYAGDTHLELHFSICERNEQLDSVLRNVWDYVEQYKGFEYRENGAFFMFHHLAHMVYHFLFGGCGIKPVLDWWVLRNKFQYDEAELLELLDKCHLTAFYKNVCLLSEVWFGNGEHNETTLKLEKNIIESGMYGSPNRPAAGIALYKGSKFKYKLSIAFPSYINMCLYYPSLRKHKILLPFCYLHRFFSKVFGKKGKEARERVKTIDNCSKEEIHEFSSLINELGIMY